MPLCNTSKAGFSLIELLVTISVGVMVCVTVTKIYMNSLKLFEIQQQMQLQQMNMFSLQTVLRQAVHQAGYIGCAKWSINRVSLHPFKLVGDDTNLTIVNAKPDSTQEIVAMQDLSHIVSNAHLNYKEGDNLILSDCKNQDVFRVVNIEFNQNGTTITADKALSKRYANDAQLMSWEENHFYFSDNALFVEDSDKRKTKIMTAINQLNFTYTVKSQDTFKDMMASGVQDWNQVVGVAISADFINEHINQTYHFYVALRSS